MFLPPSYDIWLRIAEQRMRDCLQAAETHRLLREAGIDQRRWLSHQTGRLLCRLGLLLVALGQRLARYDGLPVAAPKERELRGERI